MLVLVFSALLLVATRVEAMSLRNNATMEEGGEEGATFRFLKGNKGKAVKKSDGSASYDDYVSYGFKYEHMKTYTPTGIYTSHKGNIVLAGDDDGWIYRSHDYGKSFTHTKKLSLGHGKHASMYGCAMSFSGEKIVISTGSHANFHSTNSGLSFTKSDAGQSCGVIVGNADLTRIVCIGGETGNENYIMYGHAHASKLTKSHSAGQRYWIGIVANPEMTHVVAIEAASTSYVYISKDQGVTWSQPTLAADVNTGSWGMLCASRNAMSLMLTDTTTLNSHLSVDGGLTWIQGFNSVDMIGSSKDDTMELNSCAISPDGKYWALGFTNWYTQVASDCTSITLAGFERCNAHWGSQTSMYSDASSFQTTFMAFDKFGDKFYSVDANKLTIAVGTLEDSSNEITE